MNKNINFNNVPFGINKINKEIKVEKRLFDDLEKFISTLPLNVEELYKSLEKSTEKISSSAYKFKNYVIMPSPKYNHSDIMCETSLYMDKNPSILSFIKCHELPNGVNLYLFGAEQSIPALVKYDKNVITDAAKQDFYINVKNLINAGKVDVNELLNKDLWYMTESGNNMFTINPHLSGIVPCSETEKSSNKIFNELFN